MKPSDGSEAETLSLSVPLSSTDAVRQLGTTRTPKLRVTLVLPFHPFSSERHQQNRKNGNALQVRGIGVENEACAGEGGKLFLRGSLLPS